MSNTLRYSLVGTGGRSMVFIDAMADQHRRYAELVSLCDISQVRMDFYNRHLRERHAHPPVPTFKPDAFEAMIKKCRPDVVIVCTVDSTHHEYIVRAMEAGCDVICEKPLTTDVAKLGHIYEVIKRTGRSLRVTFNLRYAPMMTKVRELIAAGTIGDPTSVNFSWMLGISHGADYFRRWHRQKELSGGLLVHKSTHHFDLVNWWISSVPKTVFAMGGLEFYGKQNADRRGEHYDYDRYTGSIDAASDPFALHLDSDVTGSLQPGQLHDLYFDAEQETGYVRDRNVFSDGITIEDTLAVMVKYANGVVLNYSLNAYNPWEGFRVAFNGTRGRLEVFLKEEIQPCPEDSTVGASNHLLAEAEQTITVFPMFDNPYWVAVQESEGGHGGGDPLLMEDLFSPTPPEDPQNRAASLADGTSSLMIGICANKSIATGQHIRCDDVFASPPCQTTATAAGEVLTPIAQDFKTASLND